MKSKTLRTISILGTLVSGSFLGYNLTYNAPQPLSQNGLEYQNFFNETQSILSSSPRVDGESVAMLLGDSAIRYHHLRDQMYQHDGVKEFQSYLESVDSYKKRNAGFGVLAFTGLIGIVASGRRKKT